MGFAANCFHGAIVVPPPTFPAKVAEKMAFRADYKQTTFQTIANGLALYQDPVYPNIFLQQTIGSRQPTLTASGWLFDRNSQSNLQIYDINNVVEMWAVASSLDSGIFADLSMVMSVQSSYYAYGSWK